MEMQYRDPISRRWEATKDQVGTKAVANPCELWTELWATVVFATKTPGEARRWRKHVKKSLRVSGTEMHGVRCAWISGSLNVRQGWARCEDSGSHLGK